MSCTRLSLIKKWWAKTEDGIALALEGFSFPFQGPWRIVFTLWLRFIQSEWMMKISFFSMHYFSAPTSNCSWPKVEWFWGEGRMQIANQSIPSNRCQLPSDRANLSIVIGGIQQQKNNWNLGWIFCQLMKIRIPTQKVMSNQSMADGDVFLSPSLNNRRLSFHRQRQQALCATSNKNHQQRRQRASVPCYHRWTYNPSTLEKFSLILLKSIIFPSLPILGGCMKQICVIMSCMFLRLHS